jgi:type I restriction enzyme R subunit
MTKRGGSSLQTVGLTKTTLRVAPFNREGGLGKVHQLFGNELNRLIEELNGALAA